MLLLAAACHAWHTVRRARRQLASGHDFMPCRQAAAPEQEGRRGTAVAQRGETCVQRMICCS